MKIESNVIFYVCFCFIILFTNSCKAQEVENISKEVSIYFERLKTKGIQACIDNDSELYKAAKQNKNKQVLDAVMGSCNGSVSHYGLYELDTKNLLSALYKNEDSDFIIVNMIGPVHNPVLYTKSTLTLSRKKNDKKIQIISNHYQYDDTKKQYELIKDSSLPGFNLDKKMELIEEYFYYNKHNSISDKKRDQPFKVCYAIARVDGKYLIKMLYDYTTEN